jgi:hypothetical protein
LAPDQYSGFNVAGVDVIEYPDWARMGVYVMPLDVHEPIEHVVEGIQQTARPRGRDKSDWWIAPTTRPAALDELLVAQGAELTEVSDILAYDMSSRVPDTGPTSRISCRVVHDARALNEAEQVSAVMWGGEPSTGERREQQLRDICSPAGLRGRFPRGGHHRGPPDRHRWLPSR